MATTPGGQEKLVNAIAAGQPEDCPPSTTEETQPYNTVYNRSPEDREKGMPPRKKTRLIKKIRPSINVLCHMFFFCCFFRGALPPEGGNVKVGAALIVTALPSVPAVYFFAAVDGDRNRRQSAVVIIIFCV